LADKLKGIIEWVRSGHAGGENKRIRFHWEKSFIFMQIDFIVFIVLLL